MEKERHVTEEQAQECVFFSSYVKRSVYNVIGNRSESLNFTFLFKVIFEHIGFRLSEHNISKTNRETSYLVCVWSVVI